MKEKQGMEAMSVNLICFQKGVLISGLKKEMA